MFKSIIWATDGSEDAAQALPLVKELAQEGGAAITIVHVVEHVEGAGAVGPPLRPDETDVQTGLKRVTSELSGQGFNASLVIRPTRWGAAQRTRSRTSLVRSMPT